MTELGDQANSWLFKGWESLGRVVFAGLLAYAGLSLFLRISGKRTLSKMNAFDLVVTVTLGSTLSTIIVSRQTGVADELTALALLIGLQYAAIRQSGAADPADVSAVVMETDGSLTVISTSPSADIPSLQNVSRPKPPDSSQPA